MSLKATPKSLLAALAVLCIVLLQAPAAIGTVSAAQAGIPRAAHTVASRTGIRPHTISPGSSQTSAFSNTGGRSASLTPITGPVGTPITVTGTITPNTSVTFTATDANGLAANLGSTRSAATGGAFTFGVTVPTTFTFGTATITASLSTTQTATFSFGVNQASISVAPTSGTRGVTPTLTITNVAPGVAITPTIAYTSSTGVAKTAALSSTFTVPVNGSSASEGDLTTGTGVGSSVPITAIPSDAKYGTTATISLQAPYPVTATTQFTIATTPTIAVVPTAPGLTVGPLGPNFIVGQNNRLNITSNTSFIPGSPISFTIGGPAGFTGGNLPAQTAVTADGTGAFTTTIPFSTQIAGTYVITANDIYSSNIATSTIQIISGPVAGPPVAAQYFAEGYTGSGVTNGKASYVDTLDVLNPNVASVVVTKTYILELGNTDITPTTTAPDVVVVTDTLGPLADQRFDVATDIARTAVISGPDAGKVVSGVNQKVATIVQTAGFQGVGATAGLGGLVRGVAAQRTIERAGNSGARRDGDTSLGTTAPNTSYYFAEGYTGSSFQEYLLLLNPSPTLTATVSVLGVPESSTSSAAVTATNNAADSSLINGLVLAPRQRVTLNINRLNALSASKSIGLLVNSVSPDGGTTAATPIVAERTLYFGPGNGSAKPGETIAAGLTTASKQLIFAYGSLTANTPDVLGTITPTAEAAQTADDRPFIEVVNPNIAAQLVAGTLSGSATAPGPAAHVTIQLRGESGRLLGFFFTDVDAGARFTLRTTDLTSSSNGIGFPGVPSAAPTRAGVFSTNVTSSERVVAELAQYYGQGGITPSGDANSGAPGIDLVGSPTGTSDVLFPNLGTADPANTTLPLSQTVFLYNPGVNPIRVSGTFFGPGGVLAHQTYQIGPDRIATIGQNRTDVGGTGVFSATVSGAPIPAGTTGAEFSTVQQRGPSVSGEPTQAPEAFVAASVTHSADGSNWWGTQGLYPLPVAASNATATGQPLPQVP